MAKIAKKTAQTLYDADQATRTADKRFVAFINANPPAKFTAVLAADDATKAGYIAAADAKFKKLLKKSLKAE